jgi:hypothetical protein
MLYPTVEEIPATIRPAIKSFFVFVIMVLYTVSPAREFQSGHDNRLERSLKNGADRDFYFEFLGDMS